MILALELRTMSLATHQLQGSCATLQSRLSPWTKEIRMKDYVETVHMVGRTDRSLLLNRSCLRLRAPHVTGVKRKPSKISAFKGHDEERAGRTSGSKSNKNHVEIQYSNQDDEDTKLEYPKAQNILHTHTSEASETIVGSVVVRTLFKKWTTMRPTQSPGQDVEEEIFEEQPPPMEGTQAQNLSQMKVGLEILKTGWSYFMGLDATIKIPLLIFIPLYPTINLMYGAEVSRDLMPLWIAGPLIVALYVQLCKWILSLYVFTFKQTVHVVKNLPTYYTLGHTYVAHGQLKSDLGAIFMQPLVTARNLDYKEWMMEMCLDFVESIWPFYCRLIRFLKRANFI